jgi:hypothetical protein
LAGQFISINDFGSHGGLLFSVGWGRPHYKSGDSKASGRQNLWAPGPNPGLSGFEPRRCHLILGKPAAFPEKPQIFSATVGSRAASRFINLSHYEMIYRILKN